MCSLFQQELHRKKRLEDITVKEWRFTLDVNLTGLFYILKAALPEMVKSKEEASLLLVPDLL